VEAQMSNPITSAQECSITCPLGCPVRSILLTCLKAQDFCYFAAFKTSKRQQLAKQAAVREKRQRAKEGVSVLLSFTCYWLLSA